jgi:hypothetical protein
MGVGLTGRGETETLPPPLSRAGANRPACRPRAAIIKNDVVGAGTQFVLNGVAAPDRDLKAPPSAF